MQELPQTFTGIVVAGYGQARDFGTPSANIALGDSALVSGVYHGSAQVDGIDYPSLIYIGGPRKEFNGGRSLEAHLINQSIYLYGKTISITLTRFVRPKEVLTKEQIRRQIQEDLAIAKRDLHV